MCTMEIFSLITFTLQSVISNSVREISILCKYIQHCIILTTVKILVHRLIDRVTRSSLNTDKNWISYTRECVCSLQCMSLEQGLWPFKLCILPGASPKFRFPLGRMHVHGDIRYINNIHISCLTRPEFISKFVSNVSCTGSYLDIWGTRRG
jgi:hypothetical protein